MNEWQTISKNYIYNNCLYLCTRQALRLSVCKEIPVVMMTQTKPIDPSRVLMTPTTATAITATTTTAPITATLTSVTKFDLLARSADCRPKRSEVASLTVVYDRTAGKQARFRTQFKIRVAQRYYHFPIEWNYIFLCLFFFFFNNQFCLLI